MARSKVRKPLKRKGFLEGSSRSHIWLKYIGLDGQESPIDTCATHIG